MFRKIIYYCVIVITTVLLPTVQAAHLFDMEEIIVKARPQGSQSIEHITQSITILTADELREKAANSIGETLSQELGVTGSAFGQGASRPIIRGLDGSRVQIMQNGISTMDASTISVDHSVTLEPTHSNQIEILRGPATLLYGSGLSGGLVNSDTMNIPKSLPETPEFQFDSSYDTASNATTFGIQADSGLQNVGAHFDALLRNNDNYDAADNKIRNSHIDTRNINIGLSWLGDASFLGMAFGHYITDYGIPLNPDEPDEMVSIDLQQNRFDIAGELNGPVPGIESVNIRAGYVDYQHVEFENPGISGTKFINKEWEGRIDLHHDSFESWNGTFGIQYRNRDFSAVGDEAIIPPSKLNTIALFIFEDTDWKQWHLELSARYERQKTEAALTSGLKKSLHHVYSLSAGALWNFTAPYSLGFSLTRSSRPPALEEQYVNGAHLASGNFEEGNPDLNDETSNNLDISLRKKSGRTQWTFNIFFNYIEDFIYTQELDENNDGLADKVDKDRIPGGELLLVSHQQQHAIFYGIEAEAKVEVFSNKQGNLKLRTWGDWVHGQLKGGNDLPRIAPARLGINLEYNKNLFHADLGLTNVLVQNNVTPLESKTDGYTLLNAGFSYELQINSSTTNLYLRGTNLLDEDIRRHTSFLKERAPLPGRTIIIGFRAEF